MAKHQAADIRNVALVGHGAVGKTTLADLLLFKSGAVTRAGSVDDGSSLLDSDEEAKHHKHSITSTVVHFTHAGKYVNVIDTPGYPDFIGQAIGGLRAVETAITVLSASAGNRSQHAAHVQPGGRRRARPDDRRQQVRSG